jgi:hypothetical protein
MIKVLTFYLMISRLLTWLLICVAVRFEATMSQAWVDSRPEEVIQKAQQRLRERGWNDVRPALSVTIRYEDGLSS